MHKCDQKYTVAIAGATGYAGQEALRIMEQHPNFDVTCVTGHSSVGCSMQEYAPHIPSIAGLRVEETSASVLSGHDIVILALPHGASGKLASQLHDVRVVIDLGADHRLENPLDWDEFYGGEYYESWAYGMPELIMGENSNDVDAQYSIRDCVGIPKQRGNLKGASRIAGPGCNVTAVTLAFQPAITAGLVTSDIIANLVVGYSGAGRKLGQANLLAAQALGNAVAYSVGGKHRHIPEIKQNFAHAAGLGAVDAHQFSLGFTPVLVPMSRGIMATVCAPLSKQAQDMSDDDIRQVYDDVYATEKFIHMLPESVLPQVSSVIGSNSAHIQISIDRKANLMYAFSAIDNLNRGTAGQAIQSLNIALGLPEDAGLTTIGVAP
ncbi:N-acetyl-gamma-glutamyl-phosphate reductase [Alloscardovia theropitheci]|uniref:N-acetyl-gamma-glutamyl-phosphate reductase n=1 Tax=Alloscardovia theropitheci TaxID=2496842 RepID=A0A4R0QWF3_9BIFI|nr:Asd/ArgC dimerization domain-containing protein [Alloscardovia theropitheci]TCD53581.1 N-acetyl-gamma-glutamyl-phosphate reductase [Alloscardovia theropitheci]